MYGCRAAEAIRQDLRSPNLPIIAVKAHALIGDREMRLAAAMNDRIGKPIDPDRFYRTLVRRSPPSRTAPAPLTIAEREAAPGDSMLPDDLPGIDVKTGLTESDTTAVCCANCRWNFIRITWPIRGTG